MKEISKNKEKSHPFLFWLGLALLPLLASCTAPTMRNQFVNYNEAYATSLNKQMLLNLARLANGHPAYYLAIGLIDNKYTFSSQTGVGINGSFQDTHTSTANTPFTSGAPTGIAGFPLVVAQKVFQTLFGGSANESVTASSNPEFQFIPINNETAARQVLQPISTDVFLQLYQQGYPIDQLLRIMIERVETPPLPATKERLVLVNSPDYGTYERFLRACGMLAELQKHGCLELSEGNTEGELIGPVSFGGGGGGSPPERPGLGGENPGGSQKSSNPSPKDFSDAEANGFILRTNDSGGWQIFRKRPQPIFVLGGDQPDTTNADLALNAKASQLELTVIDFLKTNDLPSLPLDSYSKAQRAGIEQYFMAVTNLVAALHAGITIQTEVSSNDNAATRLVLRSFNRTMEAVATEQVKFEILAQRDPAFKMIVPSSEQHPILQITWTNKPETLEPPLETIDYSGKTYQITDAIMDPMDPAGTWNRDTFRLLVDLSSQVTVDISKFQRQVLELEQ